VRVSNGPPVGEGAFSNFITSHRLARNANQSASARRQPAASIYPLGLSHCCSLDIFYCNILWSPGAGKNDEFYLWENARE